MRSANLAGHLEYEEFTLLFKSSREFFFAPVIEYGPLAEWKEIAGGGQEMQDVFWYIKEAIDAYYDGRPFQVTVKAGCLIGRKMDAASMPAIVQPVMLPAIDLGEIGDDSEWQDLDTGLPLPPNKIAAGSVQMADPDDLQVEEIADIEDDDGSDFEIDVDSVAEQDLDAFIEGKKRPHHLDD
jgi:hypothetical protein